MLLQDVKDLITRCEFDDARSKLEDFIKKSDGDKVEAFQLLLFISQNLNEEKYLDTEKEYLAYLSEKNRDEELYTILKTKKLAKELTNFDQLSLYLDILWKLGRVQEFSELVQDSNTDLLENKRFNNYLSFYSLVKEKTNRFTNLKLGLLLYYVEKCEVSSIVDLIDEILNLNVFSNKHAIDKRIKFVESTSNILDGFQEDNYEIYYYKLLLNLIKNSFEQKKYSHRETIELLLLLKSGIHGSFILELDMPREVKDKVSIYLKKKFGLKHNDIPNFCQIARSHFKKSIEVTHSNFKKKEKEISYYKYDGDIKSELEVYLGESTKPLKSKLEKELIKQFEYEDLNEKQINAYIVSFIEMKMFHTAKSLGNKLSKSSDKYYLLAEINLKLNETADVIYYCNEAIDLFNLSQEQKLPFLYLKMNAYEQTGQKIEKRKIMQQMAKLDPSFMDVRGKLLK